MNSKEVQEIESIISRALAEDIGPGDVTSAWILSSDLRLRGRVIAKAPGIVAGLEVAQMVFRAVDDRVQFAGLVAEGSAVARGDVLARLEGPGMSILSAERVALNFLQRMSGIATLTHRLVEAVRGTRAVILDTRKTAPGLRVLDKMAVRLGGGQNHRFGLYDMVLIKDNHIAAAGSITAAVQRVRAANRAGLPVEVEVKSVDELCEALELAVDRILLDNMDPQQMRQAVALSAGRSAPSAVPPRRPFRPVGRPARTGAASPNGGGQPERGRATLEASGGITLSNIAAVAGTGVDYISVGALTHSVQALDISLDVEEE